MPILEIENSEFDAFLIFATMVYPHPSDLEKREEYYVLAKAKMLSECAGFDKVAFTGETVKELLNRPSYDNVLSKALKKIPHGFIAGNILKHHLQLKASGGNASINKAIYLVEEHCRTKTLNNGKIEQRSESSIRDIWSKYKSVTHYWAALLAITSGEVGDDAGNDIMNDLLFERPSYFISIAETFRIYASQNSIFDDYFWTIPKTYKIPELPITLTELPCWAREHLKNYRNRNLPA